MAIAANKAEIMGTGPWIRLSSFIQLTGPPHSLKLIHTTRWKQRENSQAGWEDPALWLGASRGWRQTEKAY